MKKPLHIMPIVSYSISIILMGLSLVSSYMPSINYLQKVTYRLGFLFLFIGGITSLIIEIFEKRKINNQPNSNK